jgi:hypothetical protein
MKKYAGIGSRETPDYILALMRLFAKQLAGLRYELHSGGARGADKAFEEACKEAKGAYRIWRPEHATPKSMELAEQFHPAWDRCSETAKKLHARNGLILLGSNLKEPVKFIICYTQDGLESGGTGQALRIARYLRIRAYNLHNPIATQQLRDRIATATLLEENR